MRHTLSFLVVMSCCSFGAQAASTDQLKALLEDGNYKEAYQSSRKAMDSMGEPEFDFYQGIAALEAGAPGEAVMALERYVLVFPDNRNARFNLARAYYALGEETNARQEVEGLLSSATGEDKEALLAFLDGIKAKESRYRAVGSLWLDMGIGWDNNVNSGVNADRIVDIPGVVSAPVDGSGLSVRRRSALNTFSVGAQGALPVASGVSLFALGVVDSRRYTARYMDQFNQVNVNASSGLTWMANDANLVRGSIDLARQWVDQQGYLFKYGTSGEWVQQISSRVKYTTSVQAGRMRYEDTSVHSLFDQSDTKSNSASSQRSGYYYGGGLGWGYGMEMPWQPTLSVSMSYLRESNTEHRPDYSRDVFTGRLVLSAQPVSPLYVALGVTGMRAEHDGKFGLIADVARKDTYYGVDALATYKIDRNWTLMGEAMLATQNSNIGLYDYNRNMISAKVRYEMN